MISASVCFSWKSNSDTACNNSARSAKVVRRYLPNAFSAWLSRFSISASFKGENSFSFSPVAGLMEASGISLSLYHNCDLIEGRTSVSAARRAPPSTASQTTTAILSESERDRADQNTIARAARGQQRESHPQEWSRDRSS